MKDRIEIATVTFLSAFLGGAVAHIFNIWWAYLIGMVIGGSTAYFAYRWREVISSFKKAKQLYSKWQPNKIYWENAITLFLSITLSFLYCTTLIIALTSDASQTINYKRLLTLVLILSFYSFFMITIHKMLIDPHKKRNNKIKTILFFAFLPITIIVLLCYLFIKTFSLIFKNIYKIKTFLKIIGKTLLTTLKYIHSRKRLICMIGAVIGIITSICLSPTTAPIYLKLGAITGGSVTGVLFMLFLREIIAIKILKIIPNGEKIDQ